MTDPVQSELFEDPTSRAPKPKRPVTQGSPVGPAKPAPVADPDCELWDIEGMTVPIRFVRHPRARRFRLTWMRDGSARCTLPMRGSMAEARKFVERSRNWLAERLVRSQAQPRQEAAWGIGSTLLFRGVETQLQVGVTPGILVLGDFAFVAPTPPTNDLRDHVRHTLRWLASVELPPRVLALATQFQFKIRRITVRDQRTRWGSCSARGTISLNWHLIQAPPAVVDYIILHELAHTRHMNHSQQFWDEVARICPEYPASEAWIKQHGKHLI